MRSAIRCAVCSSCLTLLASPDSAGGGLCFRFFCQNIYSNPSISYVHMHTRIHQSDISHVGNRVVRQVAIVFTPRASEVDGSIPGVLSFYLENRLNNSIFLRPWTRREICRCPLSVTIDCGTGLSIDFVGDNIIGNLAAIPHVVYCYIVTTKDCILLSIDRHCPPQ